MTSEKELEKYGKYSFKNSEYELVRDRFIKNSM